MRTQHRKPAKELSNKERALGLAQRQRYKYKLRNDVFAGYGNRCACCGEDNPGFLSIDHVDGDGVKHRKTLPGSGAKTLSVYREIRIANYPSNYQLLCFNCNCGEQRNAGVCPHIELNASMLWPTLK